MLLSWLRRRRRQKLIAVPFPSAWRGILETNVPHYATLTLTEQARLRDAVRIFVAEKDWEGCGGLTMTDEIQVTIAAFACLMVLGMEDNYFDRVQSILVYPQAYVARNEPALDGLLQEVESPRLGEAHYRGPVVLTWSQVLHDARRPYLGQNVVMHEFAHQLDMLNGWMDGTPVLADERSYEQWRQVMTREFRRLERAADEGRATLLDDYGAENEAEFFAVATECFFNQPGPMRQRHARMYELLRDYFGQDPAARPAAPLEYSSP